MTEKLAIVLAVSLAACSPGAAPTSAPPTFDVVIRGGTVYDGSGEPPRVADVALSGLYVVGIGDYTAARGRIEIDAAGKAVCPGFINVLSWAVTSLIEDGRAQSDVRQGVTLEIFGEGWSFGPLSDAMKQDNLEHQSGIFYDIEWTTLGEFLEYLEARGVSPNVASFVGATTVRVHVLGYEDRAPDEAELDRMRLLTRQAMEQGALGLGSALIYAPAFYAETDELIALAEIVGDYGGTYVSHIRSEGARLLEAIDELIEIAREAGVAAEIYHLKAAGSSNWAKLEQAIERIDAARMDGLSIGANMYSYTAGATGLDASMPPWVQEGGHDEWVARLRDPAVRERVAREMATPTDAWENLLLETGPEKMILVAFKNDELKPLTGKTLAEIAALRGKSAIETAIDLVIEDDSRVGTIYFMMSEDNIRRKIALPWISFGSDEAAPAPEGVFLQRNPHPRAYGNFARLLGRYVRDEALIPLEEAIRKLTSLPAANLKLDRRGLLRDGYYADVVVFDPERIRDRATYEEPHRYATGVEHVFVNGVQVLKDGEHTGATPGRVVRGPGWSGRAD